MKNQAIKVFSYIFYVVSIIFAIIFIALCIVGYFRWKESLLNPLVLVAPFSSMVKHFCISFLLPSVVCAVLGYIFQRINK